jgi:P27 family predicted phage terminase small subunit
LGRFFFEAVMVEHDQDDDQGEEEAGLAPDIGAPDCLDAHGKEVWTRVFPVLSRAGRLKTTDYEAFTRYCDLVSVYWRTAEKIRTDGETILTPTIAKEANGDPGKMWRRHPLLAERRAMSKALESLEDRFGMSPLARANLVAKLLGRGAGDVPPGELPFGEGEESANGDDHSDPANFH